MFNLLRFTSRNSVAPAGPRTYPDPFTITAQADVLPNTLIVSNVVNVTGLEAGTFIAGSNLEYSINGGAFTSAPGSFEPGDSFMVRITSGDYSQTVQGSITIGAVSAVFTVSSVDPEQREMLPTLEMTPTLEMF
jgi:hypothetical protein